MQIQHIRNLPVFDSSIYRHFQNIDLQESCSKKIHAGLFVMQKTCVVLVHNYYGWVCSKRLSLLPWFCWMQIYRFYPF